MALRILHRQECGDLTDSGSTILMVTELAVIVSVSRSMTSSRQRGSQYLLFWVPVRYAMGGERGIIMIAYYSANARVSSLKLPVTSRIRNAVNMLDTQCNISIC